MAVGLQIFFCEMGFMVYSYRGGLELPVAFWIIQKYWSFEIEIMIAVKQYNNIYDCSDMCAHEHIHVW